ncbi:MAG TPA: serine hydrolase domain-containing protein [Fimbriimonadaceae bacterium]|nr:serine hydrolase domain-containing protein [Fimbriimonadaceae bacterium]
MDCPSLDVDRVVLGAVDASVTPGACYAIGLGERLRIRAFGRLTYGDEAPPVVAEGAAATIWDLASLTKVVAATTLAMLLHEDGSLDLEAPVCEVLPAFGKPQIRFRNLLLHDSGLPASLASPQSLCSARAALDAACHAEPRNPPGAATVYSDIGFIVLGTAIERLGGMPLDRMAATRIFTPAGMSDTMYKPDRGRRLRCAPTERVEPWRRALRLRRSVPDSEWIVGEVHDPTAMVLGGVAGHAGLFSTALDLSRFMSALMAGRLARPSTLDLFTRRGSDASSRALGWDTPSEGSSAGTRLGARAFGHTGFTGTSIWADPDRGFFAILLTNRVHPTAAGAGITELRRAFMDAAFEFGAS